MNYGLKAYQNSTQSPYLKMHTQATKPSTLNSRMASLPKRNLMEEPVAAQPQRRYTPSQSRVQATAMTKPKIQPKVDSLKFLESMSEIYEKSGRPDLANGIRTKLSKVNSFFKLVTNTSSFFSLLEFLTLLSVTAASFFSKV